MIFSCGDGLQRDSGRLGRCPGRAGIDFLPDLSGATADDVIGRARAAKRPGDVVVVSVHWDRSGAMPLARIRSASRTS